MSKRTFTIIDFPERHKSYGKYIATTPKQAASKAFAKLRRVYKIDNSSDDSGDNSDNSDDSNSNSNRGDNNSQRNINRNTSDRRNKNVSKKFLQFSIREITRDSNKKEYTYIATRVKLYVPLVVNKNGKTIYHRYKDIITRFDEKNMPING